MKRHTFLLVIVCTLLCGCSLRPAPPPPVEFYTLSYDTPDTTSLPALPVVLSIEKFCTIPPYNTQRIIYSSDRYLRNQYYYHRWMAAPEDIITPLLARDMIASHGFQAVMVTCNFLTDYQLTGSIDEFYEQDTKTGWNAVLSITVSLINRNAKEEKDRIVFQKQYKKIQTMAHKNPESLARAMSTALSGISHMMITDIYRILKQP